MLLRYIKSSAIAVLVVSACAAANAQSVKSVISLPSVPEGLAADYVQNRIYVALPSFGGSTDSLAVIDGKSDTVVKTISIPPVAYAVAVDWIRNRVYVGGCFQDASGNTHCEVAVVGGQTLKVLETIPITTTPGNGIQGLAVDLLKGTLYVSNGSDNVIDVVSTSGSITTISLSGESPVGIADDPFTHTLYVALASNQVDLINTRTKTITTAVTVGETNGNVAVNLVNGNAFVTNTVVGPSTLGVVSGAGAVLANVSVGNTPFGVDVDPFTNLAFVTNTLDSTVSVVSGKTNTVTTTLPVTGLFVAANPTTSKVYVGGQDNSLTVISEK